MLLVVTSPEVLANPHPNFVHSTKFGDPPLSRLLNIFPAAQRLDIPIHVKPPVWIKSASEKTTLLLGTRDIAIFQLKFPVTRGDTLLLRPAGEKENTPVVVVALPPYGRGLVAARFQEVPRWFSDERARHLDVDLRMPSFMTPVYLQ